MTLNKFFLILSGLLILSGCMKIQDNPVKPKTTEQTLLEVTHLDFQKPVPGSPLTKEQVKIIKDELKTNPSMELPPSYLIYPPKPSNSFTDEWIEQERRKLAHRDPNAYQLLLDIEKKCIKPRSATAGEMLLPTWSSEVHDFEDLRAGDHAKIRTNLFDIGGANCVIDTGLGLGASAEVLKIDHSRKSLEAKASGNYRLKAVIKDPKYAKLLSTRGFIFDSSISSLGTTLDMKSGKIRFNYSISGTYLSLQSDIPFQLSTDALYVGTSPYNSVTEMLMKFTMQVRNISVEVIALIKRANMLDPIIEELYVNGHPTTESELRDLIGETFSTAMKKSVEVSKTITP